MPDINALYQLASGRPVAIGSAGVLLLMAILLRRSFRPWQSYLRSRPILTPNEREFYHRLTRALPTHPIFPQVAFSALITIKSGLSDRRQFAIRRHFGWRYADFVICKPYSLDPLLIVELDDKTHTAKADRQRDAITKAAGYQTLRFQSHQKPSVAELAALFAKLLPTLDPAGVQRP